MKHKIRGDIIAPILSHYRIKACFREKPNSDKTYFIYVILLVVFVRALYSASILLWATIDYYLQLQKTSWISYVCKKTFNDRRSSLSVAQFELEYACNMKSIALVISKFVETKCLR